MMGKIRIQVLGSPQVIIGEKPVKFPYRKTEGIFYYLCMKKQVTRDELVNIFWAETEEKTGKKNVRQVLYQLKKILGEDLILTQGNSILMINPDIPMEMDWNQRGEDFLNAEGEFLQYFYIKDCPEFDEWIEETRFCQKERWEEEIRRMMDDPFIRQDNQRMNQILRRWIQTDPLSEKVVQTAMEYYADQGQYNMAIQLFYDYRAKLDEELDEEPGEEILRMFHRVFQIKENSMGQDYSSKAVFYGRRSELFRINNQIQRFRNRESCMSQVICGGIGVGKSALMERIYRMNQANNIVRFYCHAEESDKDFYMRPWGDVLRQMEKLNADGILEWRTEQNSLLRRLLHGDGWDENSVFTSQITFPVMENSILNLFHSIACQYRIVLYIDDVQWMDAMSRQILRTLLQGLGGEELLVIATCRENSSSLSDELINYLQRKNKVEIVWLPPFNEDEISMILKDKLPVLWKENVSEEIYRRTEGNALVLMDLLDVIERDGIVPASVPDKTGQVLELQLKNLSEDQLQLMQVISVFMDSADINEIRVLLPKTLMEIYELLESLQERNMIKEEVLGEELTYRIRHKVYQEYIYQKQSMGKKKLWHRMIAEYYESKKGTRSWFEYLPYIIYQYEKCGDRKKAEQYRVQYYCEFYALSNENFPLLQTNMEYDEVAVGMSDNEADILSMASGILADSRIDDAMMKAECHFLLGRSGIARGQYTDGIDHILRCIELVEEGDHRALLLGAYRQMVFYGIQVDDMAVMDKYITRGMELLKHSHDSSDYATFLRLRGLYEYRCDRLDEADQTLLQAIELFSDLVNADCAYHLSRAACVNYRGKIHMKRAWKAETEETSQEEFRLAEDYFRQAIDLGICIYVTNGMGQFRSNLGQSLWYQGRYGEAEKYLRDSLDCFSKHEGFYWGWDRAEAYMSLVCHSLGLYTEAKQHLAEAEKMIQIMGNPTNKLLLEKCREIVKDE